MVVHLVHLSRCRWIQSPSGNRRQENRLEKLLKIFGEEFLLLINAEKELFLVRGYRHSTLVHCFEHSKWPLLLVLRSQAQSITEEKYESWKNKDNMNNQVVRRNHIRGLVAFPGQPLMSESLLVKDM